MWNIWVHIIQDVIWNCTQWSNREYGTLARNENRTAKIYVNGFFNYLLISRTKVYDFTGGYFCYYPKRPFCLCCWIECQRWVVGIYGVNNGVKSWTKTETSLCKYRKGLLKALPLDGFCTFGDSRVYISLEDKLVKNDIMSSNPTIASLVTGWFYYSWKGSGWYSK